MMPTVMSRVSIALALAMGVYPGCGGGVAGSPTEPDVASDVRPETGPDGDTPRDGVDGADAADDAPLDTGLTEVGADRDGEVLGPADADGSSELADGVGGDGGDDVADARDLTDDLGPTDTRPSDAELASDPDVEVGDSGDADGAVSDATDASAPADADVTGEVQSPLCPTQVATHPIAASPYVPVCSTVDYATDPPTSGPHYPVWATYKTYLDPVAPGFLVHSLKHGAIVITWHCPEGCAAQLTALREMLRVRPLDPRCDPLVHHRIIVAPRPGQDVMLAAAAWGASWKADCFELGSLGHFIDAHYGQGLEDQCFEGVDVEKIRPDDPWYCPP